MAHRFLVCIWLQGCILCRGKWLHCISDTDICESTFGCKLSDVAAIGQVKEVSRLAHKTLANPIRHVNFALYNVLEPVIQQEERVLRSCMMNLKCSGEASSRWKSVS